MDVNLEPREAQHLSVMLAQELRELSPGVTLRARLQELWEKLQPACRWDEEDV